MKSLTQEAGEKYLPMFIQTDGRGRVIATGPDGQRFHVQITEVSLNAHPGPGDKCTITAGYGMRLTPVSDTSDPPNILKGGGSPCCC